MGLDGVRRGDGVRGSAGVLERRVAIENFPTGIAERKVEDVAVRTGKRDLSGAGELADWFAVGFKGCARGRQRSFQAKGSEAAMNAAAGADALDDLLTEIAAFGEVESA